MTGAVALRTASAADLAHIEALLLSATLPIDGLEQHFEQFIVAEAAGAIVASAGLELYGHDALLRSVVVAPRLRRRGLGERLLDEIRRRAQRQHVQALYLLTTTSEAYFAARGFALVQREHVPDAVKRSRAFVELCPASAIAMCCALQAG